MGVRCVSLRRNNPDGCTTQTLPPGGPSKREQTPLHRAIVLSTSSLHFVRNISCPLPRHRLSKTRVIAAEVGPAPPGIVELSDDVWCGENSDPQRSVEHPACLQPCAEEGLRTEFAELGDLPIRVKGGARVASQQHMFPWAGTYTPRRQSAYD